MASQSKSDIEESSSILPAQNSDQPQDNTNGEKPQRRATLVLSDHQDQESNDSDNDDDSENAEVDGEEDDSDPLADFPEDMEELDLTHSRLQSQNLPKFNFPRFSRQLKKLCLRTNFITYLDRDIFGALVNLQELDLYDNKVKDIGEALNDLKNLTLLDLSFNLLRNIPEGLHHLACLKTIYFVENRISRIRGLSSLGGTLRLLELGGNKIRKIEQLESLTNLEELWLGKNKITKIEGLSTLSRLKILSLQSNRVTKMEGLEKLSNLEELYISQNGLQKLEGLENNSKLRVLDIGNNFVVEIENLKHLSDLEEFWANGNKIETLQNLDKELGSLKSLQTVYLEGNPCQKEDMTNYRRKVMLALPQLKQIDATFTK